MCVLFAAAAAMDFCISFFIIFAAVHEGLADRRLCQFQSVRMDTSIFAATIFSFSRVSEPPVRPHGNRIHHTFAGMSSRDKSQPMRDPLACVRAH